MIELLFHPRSVIILFLSASLGACAGDSGSVGRTAETSLTSPVQNVYDGSTQQQLTVFSTAEELAMPTQIAVIGGYVLVGDAFGEPPVHVFQIDDARYLGGLGRGGDGPGEFRSVWSFDVLPGSDDDVWIYDFMHRRMSLVDLSVASPHRDTPSVVQTEQIVTLDSPAPLTGVSLTRNGDFIATGFHEDGRVALFSASGDRKEVYGQVPGSDLGVPASVRQHAFQSTMAPRPDRTRFVLVNRHASLVEIYLDDGSLHALAHGTDAFSPVFKVGSLEDGRPALSTGDDLRFGYVDVATTADRIYALFSGRTRGEYPGSATFGRDVHVYDWDGNLTERFAVSQDLIAIAVDAESDMLYGIRHHPEPAVVKMAL